MVNFFRKRQENLSLINQIEGHKHFGTYWRNKALKVRNMFVIKRKFLD